MSGSTLGSAVCECAAEPICHVRWPRRVGREFHQPPGLAGAEHQPGERTYRRQRLLNLPEGPENAGRALSA